VRRSVVASPWLWLCLRLLRSRCAEWRLPVSSTRRRRPECGPERGTSFSPDANKSPGRSAQPKFGPQSADPRTWPAWRGFRNNALIGYGLWWGLRYGDKQQTYFTIQTLASILQRWDRAFPESVVQTRCR